MTHPPAPAVDYRALLAEFKPNDGDLLPALHRVQDTLGWIPREAIAAVARQLRMPVATVFGALSFYAEFHLEPPPETTITWCSGPACRLLGGERIREVLEATLGLEMDRQTADGRVGLHLGQCDGSCHQAPLVWLNGRVAGPLTVSRAVELAREFSAREGA